MTSDFCYIAGCFIEVDTERGDCIKTRPFLDKSDPSKARKVTPILWCLIRLFFECFPGYPRQMFYVDSPSPADILNLVVPDLGDPEHPTKPIPKNRKKLRMISPFFISHIVYNLIHVVMGGRDTNELERHIRSQAEVLSPFF